MTNLKDTKLSTKLNEETLKEVTGGSEPTTINYLFSVNQKVIDTSGWIYIVIKQDGWNFVYNCPQYECVIDALPKGYSGCWAVGEKISRPESLIMPYSEEQSNL